MISELTKKELISINGGQEEKTPEDIGYAVGHWVGKALIVWATFFKK
ncbi:bacteriocin [Pedobacter ghigonis]|nr:bacteriocin [Pedobacter ghigonis]